MKRKNITTAEREHIMQVKSLGCAVAFPAFMAGDFCEGAVEFHHLTKCGRRLGHAFGIGLCAKHHRYGGISIATGWKNFEKWYGTQLYLCEQVYKKLGKEMPEITTKIVSRPC